MHPELGGENRGKFPLFRQKKYAIPGETLSIVGGFIDEGEAPWEAARREVLEELGVGSSETKRAMGSFGQSLATDKALDEIPKLEKMLDSYGLANGTVMDGEDDWIFLGRYRTAANRGGGFLYSYLLKNAMPIAKRGGTSEFNPSGDDEKQNIVFLGMEEVMDELSQAQLQEVKWTATMSLSMLHLKAGMPGYKRDGKSEQETKAIN